MVVLFFFRNTAKKLGRYVTCVEKQRIFVPETSRELGTTAKRTTIMATTTNNIPAKIADYSTRLRAIEQGMADAMRVKDIATYNYLMGQQVHLKTAISGMESRLDGTGPKLINRR